MSDVVFHSSGSTGGAKRIVRTEESLRADAAALVSAFPGTWTGGAVVVSSVRPEYMYGALWRVRAPETAGYDVDPSVVTSVEELALLAVKYVRVLFVTTPSFLEKALHHPDFSALKGRVADVVTSGSLLRTETAAAVESAISVSPLEIYGSTEAGTVAWRRQSAGEVWTLVPSVSARPAPDGGLMVDSPYAMSRPFVMADGVSFVDERRFILLGRLDRRVKVLEKYVSLTDIEEAFLRHPFVSRVRAEAYGDEVVRIGAIIVPSAEGVAALRASTSSYVASRLRRDILPSVGATAFPRRMRFIRELPVNEHGKTTASAAREVLSAWCQEPLTCSWTQTADSLSVDLVFLPDMVCFKGHFPGCPILPGVAQLYFLRHFARQAFRDFPDAAVYRRLKFQKVITPGCEVRLSVVRRGAGSFEFSISGGHGSCASGIVEGITS